MKVDDETAALAKAVGMNFIVCCYCGLPSLYVRNEKGTNVPETCGRLKCGQQSHQPWARMKQ